MTRSFIFYVRLYATEVAQECPSSIRILYSRTARTAPTNAAIERGRCTADVWLPGEASAAVVGEPVSTLWRGSNGGGCRRDDQKSKHSEMAGGERS